MAGIYYSNGISIVHIALIVGWSFADYANPDLARELQGIIPKGVLITCEDFAVEINRAMQLCLTTHIICAISCFSKEIYETKINLFGHLIRFFETFCVFLNTSQVIYCLTLLFRYLTYSKMELHQCFEGGIFKAWSNNTIEWFTVEVITYFVFMLTMLILLFVSRFKKVGADNTKMFEPRYLSFLANVIIEQFISQLNK